MGAGESKEVNKEATASKAASTALSVGTTGSSNSVSNDKRMNAPGQKGSTIRRADFEANPKGYFRDQRRGK
ncbi:hypothetical protein MRB53_009396 [Persea americana]|uniref:Uncharacterized protein n=1 Tax=Persea americana TaxID=3435 RepID=A0ACC2LQ04_PERAE|nr:hypothetical protein MRB53_009396 [Persea americana]